MSLRRLSAIAPFSGAYTSPGAMNQYVSIYQRGARNADGSYPADALFATSWASFRALSGSEMDHAREIVQRVEAIVTLPFLAGLTQDMTIQIGAESWEILYVLDPDHRGVEQRCYVALVNQTVGS